MKMKVQQQTNVALSTVSKIVLIWIIVVIVALGGTFWYVYQAQSSCSDLCVVTNPSGYFYSGSTASNITSATSNFTFTLSNPGSTTQISSIWMDGRNLSKVINQWGTTPRISSLIDFNYWNCPSTTVIVDPMNTASTYTECGVPTTIPHDAQSLVLNGRATQSFTFFPMSQNTSAIQILHSSTYNYVINFRNGQSVSGTLMAP